MKEFIQFWKSIFYPQHGFTEEELAIIARIIKESDDIATGKYLTESTLPEPIIPERRKNKR